MYRIYLPRNPAPEMSRIWFLPVTESITPDSQMTFHRLPENLFSSL